MFTLATVLSALELGFIYALVALALFLSFRVLNIADMTTDCFGHRRGGGPSVPGSAAGAAGRGGGRVRHGVSANAAGGAVHSGGHHHQHRAVHRQPGGHGVFFQRTYVENDYDLHRGAEHPRRECTL